MAQKVLAVDGARQLRAALKRAGIDVQDLKDAHKRAADQVAEASRPVAPRRSGRLAADVRSAGTAREAIVRLGRKSVPYAGPIHWGWPARGIEARPFVWEAAQRTQDTWEATYLRAIERIIDQIEGTPGL